MGNTNVLPEETCPICMEKFDEPYDHFDPEQNNNVIFDSHTWILRERKDPCAMPCGHSACRVCLKGLEKCPYCRKTYKVDDLVMNYTMNDKLQLCRDHKWKGSMEYAKRMTIVLHSTIEDCRNEEQRLKDNQPLPIDVPCPQCGTEMSDGQNRVCLLMCGHSVCEMCLKLSSCQIQCSLCHKKHTNQTIIPNYILYLERINPNIAENSGFNAANNTFMDITKNFNNSND
jgi:hypothetical protein